MRPLVGVTVALAVLVPAARPALAANQTVFATGTSTFMPATVTVNPGESVTWINQGGSHNVKFDDGSFEQPPNPSFSAWTVSRTFTTAGTLRYHCELHGAPGGVGMSGTVVVQGAGGSEPAPPPPQPSPSPPPPPTDPQPLRVTLRVSDQTPERGERVRFHGSVRPEQDGRLVHIERRTRTGGYRSVARTRLRNAGTTRSTFSRWLRLDRDGTFRARVRGGGDEATGTSRRRRVEVHG